MEHVYWIIDKLLAGRPGPTMHAWDPAALHAGGIRGVVSLAEEVDVEDLTAYGLRHYRAKLPPLILFSKGLRKAFIHQCLPIWEYIHQQMQDEVPTLVHCYAGKDRTGVMLAGYLVLYHAMPVDVALATVRRANPRAMSAPGYEETLRLLQPGQFPDPRTLL